MRLLLALCTLSGIAVLGWRSGLRRVAIAAVAALSLGAMSVTVSEVPVAADALDAGLEAVTELSWSDTGALLGRAAGYASPFTDGAAGEPIPATRHWMYAKVWRRVRDWRRLELVRHVGRRSKGSGATLPVSA